MVEKRRRDASWHVKARVEVPVPDPVKEFVEPTTPRAQ